MLLMTNINLLYALYDLLIKYSLFIKIIFEIYFLIGKGPRFPGKKDLYFFVFVKIFYKYISM